MELKAGKNPKIILSSFGLKTIKPVAFGLGSLLTSRKINAGVDRDFQVGEFEGDEAIATSYLGTPVFTNLIIEPGSYIDNDGLTIDYEGITIDTVLMDISQSKNIVTTAIQGRNGTVKEYISDGDYMINIKGVIASNSHQYPTDEVNKLIEICKVQDALKVASSFLQLFSIHSLVIQDYSFPQGQIVNNQPFELRCLSDEPIELQINA